jgi:Ca2+-transporting ATPase
MRQKFNLNNLSDVGVLSEKEAAERLTREGYNEIPSAKKRGIFSIAFGVIREPMLLLLLASGAIYMVLGDIQKALMILGFAFAILGITLYQERKTEGTLEALRDLLARRSINV